MGSHLVEPGVVLAGRYLVEDLLGVEGNADSWRARDTVLARSVVVQILPSSSPNAPEVLAAAKKASRVPDSRILQVLDAVDDGEFVYVVREWATGQTLEVALAEGPLPAQRTIWLMREVAAAICSAHRMGLPHRRLAPDTVVVTKSSGVKVIGLGTFAALRGLDQPSGEAEPEDEDAQDLGRLLYACLTARWPGGGHGPLPDAPHEHGRLLRPRQVRAGVPRDIDALCDRILGRPPRYGEPIRTVEEVKAELMRLNAADLAGQGVLVAPSGQTTPQPNDGPPGLLADAYAPTTIGQPAYPEPAARGDGRSLGRNLLWVVVGVLVVGAMLLAYLVGQQGTQPSAGADRSGNHGPASAGAPGGHAANPSGQPIPITAAYSFDPPPGSGTENPGQVSDAIDHSRSSYWSTLTYFGNPVFGGLKKGVGLVLDLGSVQTVGAVSVLVPQGPTSLQLRAAPTSATAYPRSSALDYSLLGSKSGIAGDAKFTLRQPVRTRYLLVWLTSLPSVGGNGYRGEISNITVTG